MQAIRKVNQRAKKVIYNKMYKILGKYVQDITLEFTNKIIWPI